MQYPSRDILEKQDKFPGDLPYAIFTQMYRKGKNLYPDAGFNPLHLSLFLVRKNLSTGQLALEMANSPIEFDYKGAKFFSYELEGQGGRVFTNDPATSENIESGLHTGLEWTDTGFTLVGDPAIVSGNRITLSHVGAAVNVLVKSASGILVQPMFRLRRVYSTAVIDAVLGPGNGSDTEFVFTITTTNTPICPSSVKISFTSSSGLHSDKIRDNGKGILVTVPPVMLLGEAKVSMIDYKTGEIHLIFSSDFIPTSANITISYEHMAQGEADSAEYRVNWRIEA